MIEVVTALMLFLNGTMIEHVYKPDLGACLKSKRIALCPLTVAYHILNLTINFLTGLDISSYN